MKLGKGVNELSNWIQCPAQEKCAKHREKVPSKGEAFCGRKIGHKWRQTMLQLDRECHTVLLHFSERISDCTYIFVNVTVKLVF